MDRTELADAIELYAATADLYGSPFYAGLHHEMAADARRGGPIWDLLEHRVDRPLENASSLRLLGGVHREVLAGRLPQLASHYPSTGGDGDAGAAFAELLAVVDRPPDAVLDALTRPPQTNEVGRSAALVPGFLTVARRTGLPLRLREVGASAALNLRADHYWFEHNGAGWGEADSPVRFVDVWAGDPPPLDEPATIHDRRGCDHHPMDASEPETALTLLSYVWPGQDERFERLRSALGVAVEHPVTVDRIDAAAWVDAQLADRAEGTATIVFHSSVWQYLPDAKQRRVRAALDDAGRLADPDAPIAWLRLEPALDGYPNELRLTVWDGRPDSGHEHLLATTGFQGGDVTWLG